MNSGAPDIRVKGSCSVLLAYDAGYAIDLDRAARRVGGDAGVASRESLKTSRRVPQSFQYDPPPLRLVQKSGPIGVEGFHTLENVECTVFDFGGISVEYAIPFDGPLEGLQSLSAALYENRALLDDSRRRVEMLLEALGGAIDRPELAPVVEDYPVFHVRSASVPAEELLERGGPALARILRAEPGGLADEQVEDALSMRVSYGRGDCTLVDWHAAVVLDPDGADTLAVLEFVNMELLEMRLLDDRLDDALEAAYRLVDRGRARRRAGLSRGRALRQVATLQMDAAMLFEGVNNALKLVGDQYLARVYTLASRRLHLPDWDASILRKLGVLESIYEKLSDRQATRRMEVLEAIIIALIAVSIVLPMVLPK